MCSDGRMCSSHGPYAPFLQPTLTSLGRYAYFLYVRSSDKKINKVFLLSNARDINTNKTVHFVLVFVISDLKKKRIFVSSR